MSGALDGAIFEIEHWPHNADLAIFEYCQHGGQSIGRDDFGVIIEQQDELASGVGNTDVVFYSKVERLVVIDNQQSVATNPGKFGTHLWWCGGVGHHDEFQVLIGGTLNQRSYRVDDQWESRATHFGTATASGDDDGNFWLLLERALQSHGRCFGVENRRCCDASALQVRSHRHLVGNR